MGRMPVVVAPGESRDDPSLSQLGAATVRGGLRAALGVRGLSLDHNGCSSTVRNSRAPRSPRVSDQV